MDARERELLRQIEALKSELAALRAPSPRRAPLSSVSNPRSPVVPANPRPLARGKSFPRYPFMPLPGPFGTF
jgi:hypothetical protein